MAEKPKRPLSAYMIWLNSAREQIKRENPGIKVTEVAKKGGEIWRSMKDKSEWENKAAKAKEDYEDAVKRFEANGGSTANGGGKKRAKAGKKVAKKTKKAASDDDDDEEDSEIYTSYASLTTSTMGNVKTPTPTTAATTIITTREMSKKGSKNILGGGDSRILSGAATRPSTNSARTVTTAHTTSACVKLERDNDSNSNNSDSNESYKKLHRCPFVKPQKQESLEEVHQHELQENLKLKLSPSRVEPKQQQQYSLKQRIQIIAAFYENQRSRKKAHEALKVYFGASNMPTERTIWNLAKKFETTGSVVNMPRIEYTRKARSCDNIQLVREYLVEGSAVAESQTVSIRKISRHLGLSYATTQRILTKDLNMHAYKVVKIEQDDEDQVAAQRQVDNDNNVEAFLMVGSMHRRDPDIFPNIGEITVNSNLNYKNPKKELNLKSQHKQTSSGDGDGG